MYMYVCEYTYCIMYIICKYLYIYNTEISVTRLVSLSHSHVKYTSWEHILVISYNSLVVITDTRSP